MAEFKKLIRKRSYLKGQVTQLQQILTTNADLPAAEAQVRLKKLEEQCLTFDSIQDQIDSYLPTEEDQIAAFERANEAERETFQARYIAAAAQLQTIIDKAREAQEWRLRAANPNVAQPAIQQNANQNQPTAQVQPRNKPKLPVIKLAEFDGEYTKWMVFKNSFETTIDSDPDLAPMQEHQYLIGQLQGEARKVIEGYTITNENYGNAWKLLKDTYDNHMMIIENHLEELFNFLPISKDDKAESIRKLIWHIQTHISSLKTLKQPVEKWDTLVIHLAKKELDFPEQRDWQNHVKDHTPENMPKLDEFTKFLTERCHTMRMLGQNKPKTTSSKQPQQLQQKDKKYEKKVSLVATEIYCKFCKGDHAVHKCELLLKLTPDQRREDVKRKRLCMNCLNRGHFAQDCRASSCKICGERHNSLLHPDDGQKVESKESSTPIVTHCSDSPKADSSVSIYCTQKPLSRVILSTAQVYIRDKEGKQLICRALLDPGSQTNLMTAELARRLKLPSSNETRPISGINQARTNARKVTQVQIQGIHKNYRAEIECLVLPSITEQIPQTEIDATKIIIPKEVQLADPVYNEPGKIDILIGAALYWRILIGTPRNRLIGQPALQNTQFGWIIGGEMTENKSNTAPTCLAVTNDQLHHQMERHWKQETIPEIVHYTKEEKVCEKHYSETTSRSDEGKFIVRLPLRSNIELGNSKDQAQRRLESLERRFKRSPELKEAYLEFMDDYLACQHMSLVEDTEALKSKKSYFIPHQAVVRPDSITTKVRVVFDASAKTTLGTSLNDKLMPGPNLQKDLFKITLRFRTHQFVITADIAQMFRQILVHEQDRSLQLILWRNDPEQQPQVYELNTVTYGTACAPYHAMRCLRELASLHREEYPQGARAVDEDFYMDDVLTGAKTLSAAIELQQQMSELLWRGRFLLRKFRSNKKEVLQHLKNQNKTDSLLTIDKEEALKILGLLWDASQDTLQYQVRLPKETGMTKRVTLSRIAQVFDPLGLVAPVLITGKIFMQQLWSEEMDWDQPLSAKLLSDWNNYYLSLPQLNDLQIPRNINPNNRADKFDLFGFGDASERAFGACLYAVSTDEHGTVHSHLLCSKSKVAPLKTISLPRLELEAALLLSHLYNAVRTAFVERINQVKLWSDSTIVLGWIKTEPCILKTFVANRIAKIQDMTENATWQHVPSEENPADLLSRGIPADCLKDNDLWWHGPHWLREENQCPAHTSEPETNLPEVKTTPITLALTTTSAVLRKYSSYAKLCRVIAYCYRFRIAFTDKKKTGPLQAEELIKAEKVIVKWIQDQEFSQEQRCLTEERDLPRKSPLHSLKPFLDSEGLIRVGGRLRNAEISENEKHQIVLPTRNYVTSLIMREEHERLRHCPPEQLLHAIRQRFWPISGRREAQKVTRGCLKCFRFRPTVPEVMMGDLPQERVKGNTRPFSVTGVDYAGPIQVRESRRRGRIHISKGYVAVFTCFATKAIHLEMVTDLTSEAFLAALSRFTARRGLCSQLFSDNGTNFVGASRELKEVYELLKNEESEITSALAKQHIAWRFIPPRSPHFGGLWEAAVKIMKRHLYTVTQGKVFTFEEYSTLLAEIEAILNSRPLTPLTNDPNDLQVLTPAHFLMGGSLLQPVQPNYKEIPENRLSRWQHLQKLRQQLWQRWQREYLQELQKRIKWTTTGQRVELDTLVLLIEDNVPPLRWPLGRVVEIHPGRDGEIRVVTVKTQNGSYKRAIKKLCPLPMDTLGEDQGLEIEE